MRKKGQAAMEFLMTYGWAILAAIIVIGILGYYYFSKDTLTPSASAVKPPFYLNVANVNTTSVNLELKNNGGETLDVYSIAVSNCGTYTGGPDALATGTQQVFIAECGSALTAGETFQGDVTITYRKSGSSLDTTSTGSVTEVVA